MAYQIKQDICSGCHTCELFCPTGAIRMNFSKYQIEASKCVSCGTCAGHCHNAAIYDAEAKPEAPVPHEKIVKSCDILVIGSGFYVVDGEIKYGPMEQDYRDYLELMNRWYEEGLIFKDYYNYANQIMFDGTDMLGAGQVGLYYNEVGMGIEDCIALEQAAYDRYAEG